ncbi:F-box protein SNE [Magnolia sinica]|uniref:F-box protein SNE n=1 Tax=Magnolia sinica TaxID=86752 RepID=UPI0026584869|nr:F-box protein SNE [Magnolia sinica]
MVVVEEQYQQKHQKKKWPTIFMINDHEDILVEVLKRLDPRSLAISACVCRLWRTISLHDSLWENLILSRHLSLHPPSLRPVVRALGGYRQLFTVCFRPFLDRLSRTRSGRSAWTRDEVRLSLSLFSIDCYERLGGAPSSLRFLCEPVNV